MSKNNSQGIISVLKSEIENYDSKAQVEEVGRVITLGDGIANVYGLQHVMYGELVEFENGTTGIAQNLEEKTIGCVLLGSEEGLVEGSTVKRTGKQAGIAVGQKIIGRVVNALGEPIDGLGPIETDDYRAIESKAPGVITRQEVSQPLMTGILAIDSMFPIGRGQRELIIGDRQTGKTAIAIDTIINQKGQDVICIYVAIGQKASTVAKTVNMLRTHGAMDYTIVVNSPASEPAPMQYLAPYAGAAIGEHFMDQKKDVLIVYDDLTKHAQAYRAMSLLLHRPPGREAYPGDVFYLHSRLLERACRRNEEHGGGSMTALPIIETQAGDVSAYIPTNVISITDGQIFLETDLFYSGIRPAVNVGLSVSRVGGKAQDKIMKSVAGSLRVDLAQYREMEVFTQFSSDLDDATKELLAHGSSLIELLKQPLYRPMPLYKQVILLIIANNKILIDLPTREIGKFKDGVIEYIENTHPEIIQEIMEKRVYSDELGADVVRLAKEYKESR
ncbi:MAG: F0F1 ATP synthase subunit alpha [Anaerovoracaceae bacterium]